MKNKKKSNIKKGERNSNNYSNYKLLNYRERFFIYVFIRSSQVARKIFFYLLLFHSKTWFIIENYKEYDGTKLVALSFFFLISWIATWSTFFISLPRSSLDIRCTFCRLNFFLSFERLEGAAFVRYWSFTRCFQSAFFVKKCKPYFCSRKKCIPYSISFLCLGGNIVG